LKLLNAWILSFFKEPSEELDVCPRCDRRVDINVDRMFHPCVKKPFQGTINNVK